MVIDFVCDNCCIVLCVDLFCLFIHNTEGKQYDGMIYIGYTNRIGNINKISFGLNDKVGDYTYMYTDDNGMIFVIGKLDNTYRFINCDRVLTRCKHNGICNSVFCTYKHTSPNMEKMRRNTPLIMNHIRGQLDNKKIDIVI